MAVVAAKLRVDADVSVRSCLESPGLNPPTAGHLLPELIPGCACSGEETRIA